MTMPDKPKRQPLLIDRFIHTPLPVPFWQPRAVAQIGAAARKAQRFVFDETASHRVAHLIAEVPDLLIREFQFARAPYDVTWIEYDAMAFWEHVHTNHPKLKDLGLTRAVDGDTQVGFLIDNGRVNTVSYNMGARSVGRDAAVLAPLQYRLNTEFSAADRTALSELTMLPERTLEVLVLGSTSMDVTSDERDRFIANNVVEFIPWTKNAALLTAKPEKRQAFFSNAFWGSAGDLRTIIAMLLILNRPSITRYVFKPTARGWIRSKPAPYLSHNVVQVDIDAANLVRRVGKPNDDPEPRARHPVRGHYCHDETARTYSRLAGCVHDFRATHADWTPIGTNFLAADVRNWVCAACGGKRWWRKSHVRGDATEGFVLHDAYVVGDSSIPPDTDEA